jgi:hypothetical protein
MRTWIVGLSVLLSSTAALANGAERSLHDLSYIHNGRGESRILFRLGDLSDLGHFVVTSAVLSFPVTGAAEERTLALRIHNVSTDWNAGSVDWTSGWTRPGGDFDEDVFAPVSLDLSRGSSTASMDVSGLLKETYEAGEVPKGYLVTVASRDAEGIVTADLSRLTGLATATLTVDYLRVPRSPGDLLAGDDARPRGAQERSRSVAR